jgi:hypothetical protein
MQECCCLWQRNSSGNLLIEDVEIREDCFGYLYMVTETRGEISGVFVVGPSSSGCPRGAFFIEEMLIVE